MRLSLRNWLLFSSLALFSTALFAGPSATAGWLRASLPGQANSAGFFGLENLSKEEIYLIAASADWAERVEVHGHFELDGSMQMREQPVIWLAAGALQLFEPGGFHLMFLGVKAPLLAGQQRTVTLHFDDGQRVELSLPVVSVLDELMHKQALRALHDGATGENEQ